MCFRNGYPSLWKEEGKLKSVTGLSVVVFLIAEEKKRFNIMLDGQRGRVMLHVCPAGTG